MNMLKIDANIYRENRDLVMQKLERNGIHVRPVWILNHLQKPYNEFQNYKIEKAKELVANSLCLPSSTSLTKYALNKVVTQLNG